ncbi:lipopolysaccharide kinase InaA family protein [Halopseudomonas sp.]|uniref:lipopolysaccharide kinase InaA family protein n=1 Tax=Halopseudomonas sp. TaxID=2901191 RepID=UPI00311FD440
MSLTAELRSAGREPPLHLNLQLAPGAASVVRWLRILPAKRLVAQVEIGGQHRLLKLFIAAGSQRHCEREASGLRALHEQNIPTPELIGEGELEGGGRYLLSAYLGGAETLQQQWDALNTREPGDGEALALLGQALALIATMHSRGLVQTDLHLGNFLRHHEQVYVIDGDAVQALSPGAPLSAEQAEDNLAIFFAQLDPEWDAFCELLLIGYLQHNPLALNPDRLAAQIARVRQRRLDDFLSKTLRDCTQFSVSRSWGRFTAVVREQCQRLAVVLSSPDDALAIQPLLKDGGSSTVGQVTVDGETVVIKRYNIKGIVHWLKRFWRPSRAWHSWLAAHRLQFLGIATPAPLAMVEQRFGPLRRRAWLVTEYCSGVDLLRYLGEDGQRLPDDAAAAAMLRLFAQLVQARISHGDLKATNLLWWDGKVVLIDLDAMQAHASDAGWQRAWQKDRQRFIRNWPAGSPLAGWLDERLPRL